MWYLGRAREGIEKYRSDINESVVRQTETINTLYAFIGAASERDAGCSEEELEHSYRKTVAFSRLVGERAEKKI